MTTATAFIGSAAAEFVTSQCADTPRTVAFTGAVWQCAEVGLSADELTDLAYVREIVAGQIVNGGLEQINETLGRMAALQPHDEWYGFLREIRTTVRLAFATELDTPPAPRDLVGVA